MNLRKKIGYFLQDRYGLSRKSYVQGTIREKSYQVVPGTLGSNDYDKAWLLALARRAKVVFDIGCNIGQSSLLVLYFQNIEQVILVDPNPLALSMAAENLIINQLAHKARFVCALVSDQVDQLVEFYTVGCGAAGSIYTTHAVTAASLGASARCVTTTVDRLADQYCVAPDLVKIDVEGAEYSVLQGAVQLARQQMTRFLVEVHSNPEVSMQSNAQNILSWCRSNSYRAWYLKEKTELIDPAQVEHRGRCHLLLLPSQAAFPEWLLPIEQSASLESVDLDD